MKFSQLAIGQTFRYQGEAYTKTTPLMARPLHAEGEQRLLPRSAGVELLDDTAPPRELPGEIPLAQLDSAMTQLSADINQTLADSGLPAEQLNALLRQLQAAFTQCRRNLNLD